MRRSLRAFTLIELLVVVAIIALLVAILLPSLAKARDQAKSSVCLANLKSISNATNMYAANWDGVLPANVWTTDWNNWTSWDNYLYCYLNNVTPFVQFVTPGTPNGPNEKIFHCPAPSLVQGDDALALSTYSGNVGVFPTWHGDATGKADAGRFFQKLSALSRPGQIIAASDGNQSFYHNSAWFTYDYDPTYVATLLPNTIIKPDYTYLSAPPTNHLTNHEPSSNTGMRYRHREQTPNTSGFCNSAFVDGHAESMGVNTVQALNIAVKY